MKLKNQTQPRFVGGGTRRDCSVGPEIRNARTPTETLLVLSRADPSGNVRVSNEDQRLNFAWLYCMPLLKKSGVPVS